MNKIGRNDLCPCGSGKKYKQCCLAGKTHQERPTPSSQGQRSASEAVTPAEVNQLATLFRSGHFLEMETVSRAIAMQRPNSGFAWKAFGASLLAQGKDALQPLQRAATLLPDDAETFNNLGNTLRDRGQFQDALANYRKAIALKPDFTEAHGSLGDVLRRLGRPDDAITCFRKALFYNPNLADVYINLGNVLRDIGQLAEAISSYRQAVSLRPQYVEAHNNLLMAYQFVPSMSKQEVFDAHKHFGEQFEAILKPHWPVHSNNRDPNRRLKVGYVSGDFRWHPVAFFIEPVLAHHDKIQFEIYCYANSAISDTVTERLMAEADHWLTCHSMSDEQLAQRIRADGIDILVDLSGHTAYNRLSVFARKPAPIQITYLGYPGTTGLSAMDYRLTDSYSESPESDANQYCTEELICLSDSIWCYRPPQHMPEVTPLPALANGYLTFGSFNNFNKIGDECIALWAALLRSLPTSRLLMATVPEGDARTRLSVKFKEHGVAPERIDYCGSLPPQEFQRKLQQADLTLDPFPVNGATTTCESMWLGVPVMTLVGERFLSRAGLSVLNAAHMSEFVATTQEGYIETATALAKNLPQLAALRAGMRERLKSTPLFDQQRFTRNVEAIYRDVWQRHTLS
jgi:protein O-GlcNAc transferase